MDLERMEPAELTRLEAELSERYRGHQRAGLALDITRGNPSLEQLELARGLDGVLGGDYRLADGTDARGYGGGLDGIPEARALAAAWLGVEARETLVGGNSSLELMYLYLDHAHRQGVRGPETAWSRLGPARFLCPVPGYDRHFRITQELGIELLPLPMGDDGPDMDQAEAMVRDDPAIRGMWCVPKYSNPGGQIYSDAVVERVAALARHAGPHFRVMWDNAYAVHDLDAVPASLASVMEACRRHGTEDAVVLFGSTSKVTFAGAGMAFMAASADNLAAFKRMLGVLTIGPDKVNQLRHVRFLRDMEGVYRHMQGHAGILRPKFDCVQRHLADGLTGRGMGTWTRPRGGYFVSFETRPGLAREVVRLAAEVGLKLTPAGAAYPYGKDPRDSHVRIAPSYPPLAELDRAMEVFVTCVQLASVRQVLGGQAG
ncbi:MAG: aminotransferase class I/II-fold pyridoxal phosphate-dependent enzyme [Ectothiorhodospiraceae bacterium]|nr:aminotransferase class I/II-fold pyridoxal phosphate-dependent enzyme [Chromatiales bacterium]MCP5155966.1 aminotransferase class I/II-fold pyridoxal phosphate-dependent enzyme [Ectothiorhodospiraceae bacterium]